MWDETVETLVLVVAGGHPRRWRSACRSASGQRTIRAVYRVLQPDPRPDCRRCRSSSNLYPPCSFLFGVLGIAPGMIVTVIFAMPAPIRLTYLGITSVPKPMIEAGQAFGRATRLPAALKVELPVCDARPSWPVSPSASCCRSRWW